MGTRYASGTQIYKQVKYSYILKTKELYSRQKAQSVKCLPCKYEWGPELDPQQPHKKLGLVVHAHNPSNGRQISGALATYSMSWRPIRNPISKNKWIVPEEWHSRLTSNLYPCTHTHTRLPIHKTELCTKARGYMSVTLSLGVGRGRSRTALVTQQAQSQPELYKILRTKTCPLISQPRELSSDINSSYLAYQGGHLAQTTGVPVRSLKAWSGQMWVYHVGGCSGAVEPETRGQLMKPCHYRSSSRRQRHTSKREQNQFLHKCSPQEKAGLGESSSPAEVYDVSWWSPVYWHWIQLEL